MTILGLHHAAITISAESEADARYFYLEVLSLPEIPKPAVLRPNGGFWCQLGTQQLHISLGKAPDSSEKAHLAYAVEDLEQWRLRLETAGIQIQASPPLPGMTRFECRDPFGNRMEFLSLTPDNLKV
ncbi:MAG: VOC family protein [Candidatus Sericytochromatia bacterium]